MCAGNICPVVAINFVVRLSLSQWSDGKKADLLLNVCLKYMDNKVNIF